MSERLRHQQFIRQHEQGQLALALVGMSNVGKSLWARRLADSGFRTFECDGEIERHLEPELRQQGYAEGLTEIARWMGQPYEPQFTAHQQRYLELEAESVRTALDINSLGNSAIDTTGSVIYLNERLLATLRQHTTVVHLAAGSAIHQAMYQQYIAHPKPVIWGDTFQPYPGEAPETALQRLYPVLLKQRSERYETIAHATITRDVLLSLRNAAEFLDAIEESLANTAADA